MTCPDDAQLQRYHDEQLPASQRAMVESHLQTCARCRRELLALRQISDAVFHAPLTEPDQQVMARLGRSLRSRRERQIQHLTEWAMAAAAAIVLGIFGLWPSMDAAQAEPLLSSAERAMLASPADESLPASVVTARLLATDLSADATGANTGSQTP